MSGLDEAAFLGAVDAITASAPDLTPLHAGLLAAIGAGLAADTIGFARLFGIGHGLVLRAANEIGGEAGFLALGDRNARTQRTRLALTARGRDAIATAGISAA